MAMGKRKSQEQHTLFIPTTKLPQSAAHPFYAKLNEVLAGWKFDEFVEGLCAKFYEQKIGRPSLAPGKYFRLLLIGYFEGIDSERGIAWRCSDSLSLRAFVGYRLDQASTEHSTISRTRRLIDLETHQQVFAWVLKVLADYDLISGKTVGVDATTLEANAAMRSIVRKDTKQNYQDFLSDLARASGIQTPTREDLAKIDRKRKHKASNDDWENPNDPDAKITRMKDGRTHLAHKAEHAVDMGDDGAGAILAVRLQGANLGDTTTMLPTIAAATENLRALADDQRTQDKLDEKWMSETVADKGYHSNAMISDLAEMNIRGYVSEPDRGRRKWTDQRASEDEAIKLLDAKDAVYANRRRIRGRRGRRLMRQRGELIERSFTHAYDTGGMRRTHLRRHDNIAKRLLIHVGGFNLGLVMRKLIGIGKPRRLQGRLALIFDLIWNVWSLLAASSTSRAMLTTGNSTYPRLPLSA
jgi:transposase